MCFHELPSAFLLNRTAHFFYVVFLQSILWIIFLRRDKEILNPPKKTGIAASNPVLETPQDADSLHKELLQELQKGKKKGHQLGSAEKFTEIVTLLKR